jgi:hypothetical protein
MSFCSFFYIESRKDLPLVRYEFLFAGKDLACLVVVSADLRNHTHTCATVKVLLLVLMAFEPF